MNRKIAFIFLFSILLLISCRQESSEVITRRIQYDVNIKSPDSQYDWWIQNLVGPQREHFVRLLLEGAKNGKYQAYDYFYQPISRSEVAKILSDTFVRKVSKPTPPYSLIDTLVIEKITIKDIQKLRFLEEWKLNTKHFAIDKKVLGIAPIAKRFDRAGNIRWQPLFWLFPDTKVVENLRNEVQP
jgi:hypothetical protein